LENAVRGFEIVETFLLCKNDEDKI